MNIWVVCQYYAPETSAPTVRWGGFATRWVQAGHGVVMLTGVPNHPKGQLHADYIGKPTNLVEEMDGVQVWRHWLFITPNSGKFKRAWNQLTFAGSLLYQNFWRLTGARKGQRPDVIIASSPSFFCALSAWVLAVRYRVPFVFEVRDLWPAIFLEMDILSGKNFLYRVLEALELFLYARARHIVTVTEGFAADIQARTRLKSAKFSVIFNGVADAEIDGTAPPEDVEITRLRGELKISPLTKIILYAGNHGHAQALGQVVEAARLMLNRTDCLFLFVGEGAEKEKLQTMAKGMPNVQFLPNQPRSRLPVFYAAAYGCVVCLKNIPSFSTFIPSKMFEIMAAGRPVIGCVKGEAAKILENSGASVVVPSEDAEKLAGAIGALLDDPKRVNQMSAAGKSFVSQKFRHSVLAQQYLDVLGGLVKK